MVILNSGNNVKEELWNDYRVYTIEAKDVECIIDLAMTGHKLQGMMIFF